MILSKDEMIEIINQRLRIYKAKTYQLELDILEADDSETGKEIKDRSTKELKRIEHAIKQLEKNKP